METITIVVAALTALLLLCQLMCGMWIRKGTDAAGKKFHTRLGIWNVITGLATATLAIILAAR